MRRCSVKVPIPVTPSPRYISISFAPSQNGILRLYVELGSSEGVATENIGPTSGAISVPWETPPPTDNRAGFREHMQATRALLHRDRHCAFLVCRSDYCSALSYHRSTRK